MKADLAIIGGSFAGLACAKAAAARGVKTVVLEAKTEAGEGIRTTGILVKEIADRFDFPSRHIRKIHGIRLYSPSLEFVDLKSPGYYFLATDTPELMRWLAREAETAGALLRYNHRVRHVDEKDGGFALAGGDLSVRFLVGADGARSSTARLLGLQSNRRYLLGVEQEWQGIRGIDADHLHVFLDSKIAPGYIAWVVPGPRVFQIGLALNQRQPPKLEEFIGKLQALFDFNDARVVGRRGGWIPVGGVPRPVHHPRALLLGDAAGTVSPLTGGGIHPAMEIGREAGVRIADHLLDGAEHPAEALRRRFPHYRAKMVLRLGVDWFSPPNILLNAVIGSKIFQSLAQTVFFHHRGLWSAKAWSDIFSPPKER